MIADTGNPVYSKKQIMKQQSKMKSEELSLPQTVLQRVYQKYLDMPKEVARSSNKITECNERARRLIQRKSLLIGNQALDAERESLKKSKTISEKVLQTKSTLREKKTKIENEPQMQSLTDELDSDDSWGD